MLSCRSVLSNLNRHALLLLIPLFAVAVEASATDYDKSVFEFQSKMAEQGNAKAQYYLAQMYEQGRGTNADPEMARHWYQQAERNGYQAQGREAGDH